MNKWRVRFYCCVRGSQSMKERAHYACVTRPDCIFATLHNPPPTFLAGSPSLSKTPFWCEQLYTQQSSSERREVLVIWTSAQDLLTLLLTPKTCTLESGYHSQNRSWPPKDDKVELCHAAQFFPNESLVRSHWFWFCPFLGGYFVKPCINILRETVISCF